MYDDDYIMALVKILVEKNDEDCSLFTLLKQDMKLHEDWSLVKDMMKI